MRSTVQYPPWNTYFRFAGIEACLPIPATRILRNAARFRRRLGMAGRPVVRRPFPIIVDHIVDSVPFRRERPDRRCSIGARSLCADCGKRALPGVGHELSFGVQLVAPGEFGVLEATTSGQLPFGLAWQFHSRPVCICLGVAIGDMNDRMFELSADIAAPPWGCRGPCLGSEFACAAASPE